MCIQCGRRGIARPRKPCQSNGCKDNQSEYDYYSGQITLEFFVQEILRPQILAQDYHSDDDVSAISDSDSDVWVTVEKADIVEFLDDDSSTLAGFEEELSR